MNTALRRFFSMFDSADWRTFVASPLASARPTARRRAPHRRRRPSVHAIRFRKQQIRRALPLLVEMPISRMC